MNLVGEAGGGVGGEGADGEGGSKGGGIGCGDVGGGGGGGGSGEGFRGGGGGNDGGGEAGGGDGDNGGDGGHMPEAQIAPLSEANVSTYWTNAGLSVQAQLISSLLVSDNESASCRGGGADCAFEACECAMMCWEGCEAGVGGARRENVGQVCDAGRVELQRLVERYRALHGGQRKAGSGARD